MLIIPKSLSSLEFPSLVLNSIDCLLNNLTMFHTHLSILCAPTPVNCICSPPPPLSTQTVYMLPPLPSTSNLFATHQSEHKIRSWPTCDIQTPPKIFSVTSNHSPLHRSYLFLCPYLLLSILLWPQSLPGHFHKTPILSFLHQVWFFKSVLNCHDDGILHLCPFVSVCPH